MATTTTTQAMDGFRPDVTTSPSVGQVTGSLEPETRRGRLRAFLGDVARERSMRRDAILGHVVEPKIEETVGRDTRVRAGISDVFNVLATAAVTIFVAIFVVSIIGDALDVEEGGFLYEEMESIEGYIGDAFMLGAVGLIILVASVILWLIGGFGENGRRF